MDRSHIPSFDPAKLTKASAEDYSSSQSDDDNEDEFLMPSTNPDANEFASFNPRKRRRVGRNMKESAALGIFGSDSEDDRPGGQWKRKTLRNKGLSFVSGGDKPAGSDEDEEEDEPMQEDKEYDLDDDELRKRTRDPGDVDEADEDDDEDDGDRPVGLGFHGASGQGLGWTQPQPAQPTLSFFKETGTKPRPPARTGFGGSTPLGQGFVPSSAREPVLLAPSDDPQTPRIARPSAFSTSSRTGKAKPNPKSFGARMMAKMGFVEGQGLGAEGQGRNVIIEATLRPQGMGLGAVKEKGEQERQEEKRQARLRGETVIDSDEEEKKKRAARRKKALAGGVSSGAGSGASTPKRQKPKYMTLDEVKKVAPGLNIPDAFTPILDLTGPGRKMLTSSSGLMTPTNGVTTGSAEDEDSKKLAQRAQGDFMAIVEEWQSLQERKAYIELQLKQQQQELEELIASVDANLAISSSCESLLSERAQNGVADDISQSEQEWDRIVSVLKTTAKATSDTILPAVKDELADLAVGAIHPAFKVVLRHWAPLRDPTPRYIEDLKALSDLLGVHQTKKNVLKPIASPYEAMIYTLWLPHVTSALREWDVRDTDRMLAVFESWQPLLPRFVRAQLLEREIVRKLDDAVQKWEPKRKKYHNLPHVWIFPWLQHLPAHHLDPKSPTGLVADVKRKFRQLIDVWEFERGVIPGLLQWKDVLRPSKSNDQWRPLVMNHVIPSMARYLRTNFRVDPGDQEPYLEMLMGVFKWTEVLSPPTVAEVLVAEVFPQWLDALYQWLLTQEVNYEEVAMWLEWWAEEVFPEEIAALPSISAQFVRGCRLINEALDLGERAKTELAPPEKEVIPEPRPAVPKQGHHRHQHAATRPAAQPSEPEEVTFRNVVEDWCEANDLQFIPERKKAHAEGPLYRITARGDGRGGVLGFFKGNKFCIETKRGLVEIRGENEADWSNLLEMAH